MRVGTSPYPRPVGPGRWEVNSTQVLEHVHEPDDHIIDECALHNPTSHKMSDWQLFWRDDRSMLERICRHGVGHPDPDQVRFWVAARGETYAESVSVHGCDGCCRGAYEGVFSWTS